MPNPDLPPVYRPVALREHGDAFAHACRLAPAAGAGTLVWVRRFDTADLAVVLEPEERLATARLAIFAGLNAAADALIATAPPRKPLGFAWPDAILCDGGLVGGARLAWPDGTGERDVPDWLVLGVTLRVENIDAPSPGMKLPMALRDEGFADFETADFVGAFARHLMVALDEWGTEGPGSQVVRWGARAGGVPVSPAGELEAPRQSLAEALAAPSWLDPASGEVRA